MTDEPVARGSGSPARAPSPPGSRTRRSDAARSTRRPGSARSTSRSLVRAQLGSRRTSCWRLGRDPRRCCRCCSGCVPPLGRRPPRSACRCRGCCSASRSTRGWSRSAGGTSGAPSATRRPSSDLVERRDRRERRWPALLAVAAGRRRHAGDRRVRAAGLAHHQRLLRRLARGRPGLNASAIGGEYLSAASFLGVAGLVLAARRRHALVPGRLDRRLPRAAGARRRPAAPLRRLHAARLRRVPARVARGAPGRQLARRADRRALPGAAVPGRRADPERRSPAPRRGSARSWSPSSCWSTSSPAACAASPSCRPSSTGSSSCALLVPAARPAGWSGTATGRPRVTCTAADWVEPLHGSARHSTSTYSLILATFLGTMGLPHVVVRFYTNPDGRAARRTTLRGAGAAQRLLPAADGVRRARPHLRLRPVAAGRTDSVVLELPRPDARRRRRRRCSPRCSPPARSRRSCPRRRAWSSSVGGVLSQDLLSRRLRRGDRRSGSAASSPPAARSCWPWPRRASPVAHAVELAFAVAASTFCPLLLLGIWWRGLTARGAIAGLLVGGVLSGDRGARR